MQILADSLLIWRAAELVAVEEIEIELPFPVVIRVERSGLDGRALIFAIDVSCLLAEPPVALDVFNDHIFDVVPIT